MDMLSGYGYDVNMLWICYGYVVDMDMIWIWICYEYGDGVDMIWMWI